MERYKVLDLIGEGSFGRVYRGRLRFTGQSVALKFISKTGRSEKEINNLKRELEIMKSKIHSQKVLFIDNFSNKTPKYHLHA